MDQAAMKVFICKFFNEEGIEQRISRLVSRERKKAVKNLRIFCFDKQVQKRLELIRITSEIVHGFHYAPTADDELYWEKAYQLSDELHLSAENQNTLKYSGVNFLSLEYDITRYVRVIEFSNLCRRMVEQNCETLIFILNGTYKQWLQDINTSNIKTIKYEYNTVKFRIIAGRCYQIIRLFLLILRGAFILVKTYFKGLMRRNHRAYIQETQQEQKRALFLVTSMLYTRPAIAICNECPVNGLVPYVAPDRPNLAPLFHHNHIKNWQKVQLTSTMLFALQIRRFLPLLYRLRKYVKSCYENGSYPDTESNEFSVTYLCSRVLLNTLFQLGIQATYRIIFLEKLISVISPDIICLMPDGGLLQQLASALAKKYNIPTLACSAAIDTGNARSYIRHLHANKVAAMGEISKEIYLESGLEPARIIVTGIAHFDQLFNRNTELDSQVLMSCGIDPGKKYIIFTTDNIDYNETETMLIGVINATMKIGDIQLVVKVHPGEDIEKYQILADKYHDSRINIVKDIDLYALISNCELLITKYSTTALEAMMIDKQVITINLSGEPTPVPYAEEGAALGVYQYEEIEPAILKSLYDEETQASFKEGRNNFVRRWAGETDGGATQRIVNLMNEMIADSHNKKEGRHA